MDRKTESGQILIETALLALFFVGLFLTAVLIAETGGKARSQYEFSHSSSRRMR